MDVNSTSVISEDQQAVVRQKLKSHFDRYLRTKDECSASGDFTAYAALFAENGQVDHHGFGKFHGREEILRYIRDSIAPFGTMFFTIDWMAFDEKTQAVVFQVQNVLPYPPFDDPTSKRPFQFPNWTRLVFDLDTGEVISEETVYNPLRDAGRTVKAWREAGGEFKSKEKLKYQFSIYPSASKGDKAKL